MKDVYLPPESQRKLMELSRCTLQQFVRGAERQTEDIDDPYLHSREYGAFVSLHKRKELRGCIGNCAPKAPLFEIVAEMTEAAASRDPRVTPVSQMELDEIRIDITLLSPLESVHDPLALEIGRHGLYVALGEKRAVLLPQVATQYGWSIETFLEQTCLKAGLRKNAWKKSDIEVSGFTTLIIEEQK
ncbi:MAG TPA: AmmeMemoRadiSam system protein A [Candidatus Binatia bacterium]|nr:AmmeMemoRadiSam system protein A [Candidatus Binatia bacterium]